jgi:predicted phage terminase large subunit-like protein
MQTSVDDKGRKVIKPQAGPQTEFCSSPAQIIIYGGAAYSGKSVAMLIEASRNVKDSRYRGIIFRRKHIEIIAGGGLWDTSMQIYPPIKGKPTRGLCLWKWASGAEVKFAHLNQDSTVEEYQGSAFVFIGFDELTHFSRHQFIYMLTRNRPPAGSTLRPYMRATCNPDADSWVADLISWWINQETGYPIPERSGVIRYFTIEESNIRWVAKEWQGPNREKPLSFTFIPGNIEDNVLGNVADPNYRSNLLNQDRVTRERLLRGNWLISFTGMMFDSTWFEIVDEAPAGMKLVRYWDLAESEVDEKNKNDPDWTAGALCGIKDEVLYVIDVTTFRETPGKGEELMIECAQSDGHEVEIAWEEVKANGKWVSNYFKKLFDGYETHADPVEGSKVERARPWSAWAEKGRVKFVKGAWNNRVKARAGKFPDGKKDDIDAISGAFKVLVGTKKVIPYYVPTDDFHLQTFDKELEDFQKVDAKNVEVYISLWMEPSGSIYGAFYIWSLVNQRLRCYNEFVMHNVTTDNLVMAIIEKAVIPLKNKGGWVSVHKIIGNEMFFSDRYESLMKAIGKYDIKIRRNEIYDENSAIIKMNTMFSQNQIIIHNDCVETDIQLRGWKYGEKTQKPSPGYPMARAMSMIISDLRYQGKVDAPQIKKQYSFVKRSIRETLRGERTASVVPTIIDRGKKMYEYLTR